MVQSIAVVNLIISIASKYLNSDCIHNNKNIEKSNKKTATHSWSEMKEKKLFLFKINFVIFH